MRRRGLDWQHLLQLRVRMRGQRCVVLSVQASGTCTPGTSAGAGEWQLWRRLWAVRRQELEWPDLLHLRLLLRGKRCVVLAMQARP